MAASTNATRVFWGTAWTADTLLGRTDAQDHGSQVLTTWQSIGAVAIALLAPLLGNLADRGGARNMLLRVTTIATVVVVALMPSPRPRKP